SRIHFGLTEIEPYLWLTEQATRLKRIYTWPVGTAEEAIKRAQQSLENIWSWADPRGHIASDEFSLADIYYYHLITWASQLAIAHPPVVADYLARMEARPAMPEEMRQR
ncbi:MAG: glutathione S-transferase, partial [Halothiobacillaceae bacterium]